jgi:hypothetical protein
MAFQSFQNFEWLHLQPSWFKPVPKLNDALVQNQAARIVDKEVLRWNGFDRGEAARLVRLKGEYEGGFGRRG